jgi:two-component system, NarL family, sensor kinase
MRGWSAAGLGLAGLCLALAGIGIASDFANGLQFGREPSPLEILAIALTATYGATGALITRHRPANPIGWIFLGIALDTGLTAFGDTYAQRRLAMWQAVAWWQQWSFYLSYPVAFSLILMLFPHGRLPSARWRLLAVFAVVAEAPRLLLAAVVSSPVIGHMSGIVLLTENPAAVIPAGFLSTDLGGAIESLTWALPLIAFVGAVAAVISRRRNADDELRRQLKWLALVAGLAAASFALHFAIAGLFGSSVADVGGVALALLLVVGFPFAIFVALVKYGLYEIDVLINRTVVFGVVTAVLIALYIGTVQGLGALLQQRGNLLVALLATGLVAAAFAPVRVRVQGVVDRLLFGSRPDPYVVLAELTLNLAGNEADRPLLVAVAETVAQALRLPYAAILIEGRPGEGDLPVAEVGTLVGEPVVVPLVYQGQQNGRLMLGRLMLGRLSPGDGLPPHDARLLGDLARHAAVAIHTVLQASEVQRSRERLVAAREEERRRLRRDLHDGLGPTLAAQTLKAGSARALLSRDPARTGELLEEIELDAQTAIADVRRLVYDLRPHALDELGLAGAIRQAAAQYGGRLELRLAIQDRLPSLPAAVEVAALRIAQEALTNVTRHASARFCDLRLSVNGDLRLEIEDDGVGIDGARPAGVGLLSMRERASELGGACQIGPGAAGGTRVFVQLPVRAR